MIVKEIGKNAKERIKVSVEEYRGHRFIDCWVYFEDNEGEWRPTKKGIALNHETVEEVVEALKETIPMLQGAEQ